MSRRCMITLQSSTPSPLLKNMSKKWWALFFWEGFNFLVEKGVTIIEQPFDHVAINPLSNSTHNQDLNRFQLSIENITVRSQLRHKTILETCDIWDTDSNSDNWEPEFMTMTVNSICNCDVLKTFACSFCKGFPCEGRTLCTRLHNSICPERATYIILNALWDKQKPGHNMRFSFRKVFLLFICCKVLLQSNEEPWLG